jgi:hypothetical protein
MPRSTHCCRPVNINSKTAYTEMAQVITTPKDIAARQLLGMGSGSLSKGFQLSASDFSS